MPSCTSALILDDLCQAVKETLTQSGKLPHTTHVAKYQILPLQNPSQHSKAKSHGTACEGVVWGH